MRNLAGIIIVSIAAVAANAFGQTYQYQFSTPITGGVEMNVGDWDQSAVSAYINFNQLTETVYYDPINNTLRQTGYITTSASPVTSTMTETRTVNGQSVSVSITVNQQVANGIISFDSGTVPYNKSNTNYPYYANFSGSFQIAGTYSMTTGGQTYTGLFTPVITFSPQGENLPFFSVSNGAAPGTITLSGSGGSLGGGFVYSGDDSFVTASNGVSAQIYSGSDEEHNHDFFSLQTPGSLTATLVPEPSTLALICAGGLSLLALKKPRRS